MPSVSLAWFWCWRGTQSKCQTKFASRESRCRPARHRGGSSQPSSHQHHHRHHHYNHPFNHRHRMGTNHQYQVSNGALGRCANNQNGNLRWPLPLGVDPPLWANRPSNENAKVSKKLRPIAQNSGHVARSLEHQFFLSIIENYIRYSALHQIFCVKVPSSGCILFHN